MILQEAQFPFRTLQEGLLQMNIGSSQTKPCKMNV